MAHHLRPRTAAVTAALAGLMMLSACSNGGPQPGPTWVPQQDFHAQAEPRPQLPGNGVPAPQPSRPGSGGPQSSTPGGPPKSGAAPSQGPRADPAVVATKLALPTGLVVLPDGTAVVGERRTGRLLRVQPVAGKPVTLVQKLSGLDTTGDGGLLDLALSPTYRQDGLLYAYVTTPTDNRVLHFTLGATPTPVVTGIPRGSTGNAGRIAFDATGALLIGTGTAGDPALAANPRSLAGKILRTNDIGAPLPDNPTAGSIIFATGLAGVDGLCVDPIDGTRIAVSAGSGTSADEINVIRAGRDYGWPRAGAKSVAPAAKLPKVAAGGAGCAVAGQRLAVATTAGKALASAQVSASGTLGSFDTALAGKYGRLRTVVAGSDGALWLTTANRDARAKPTADDDRVIRLPSSAAGGSSVV